MSSEKRNIIKGKIAMLKRNISDIAQKCGRNPQDIKLMAVTKGAESELILNAFEEGIDLFGENYLQEASKKLDYLFKNTRLNKENFHFIGHLQKNKINKVLNYFSSIDSIDSVSLSKSISEKASQKGITISIMIEVKTSQEQTKFGLSPKEAIEMVQVLKELPFINLTGVMTMAPLNAEDSVKRENFRTLYSVWKEIKKLHNLKLPFISMGMSDDYKMAIEEGATMLRIGRAIFGRS